MVVVRECPGDQTFGMTAHCFPVEAEVVADIRKRERGLTVFAHPSLVRLLLFLLFVGAPRAAGVEAREHLEGVGQQRP